MAKVLRNVEEVKSAREEGKVYVFNRENVLAALKATPLKAGGTRGGSRSGALSKHILECVATAKDEGLTELGMAQIKAMLGSFGYDITDKKVSKEISDKVWGVSDRNKNCAKPVLGKSSVGVYTIL